MFTSGCWTKKLAIEDFVQEEKRAKYKTLQDIQVALQPQEADYALTDELCLLCVCVQQDRQQALNM